MVSSRLLSSFVHALCGRCDAKLRLKDLSKTRRQNYTRKRNNGVVASPLFDGLT